TLVMFNMKAASLKNDEKKVNELYTQSKDIINSMSNTIEDFMNFFNPKKQKIRFEVKDAIDEALNILRKTIQKEEIKIDIKTDCKCEVLGILNELSQTIINLIQNSKDAFNQNNIKSKKIKILLTKKNYLGKNYSFLDIMDNAGGINEDYQDKIFEPYFTTKHEIQGTGLGLFMSKMIIEKSLDGQIEYCKYKDGSKFTILIPMD
ncbi:MAG: sensor histidine kinase, partial [Campylobacterota bacterium]